MKLDRINFDHFMIEVKDIIKPEHIALLNPNMQVYYKLGHIYLALYVFNSKLTVEFAINTGKKNEGDWVGKIIEDAKKSGMTSIIFLTAEGNTSVNQIAHKIGAKEEKRIENYYSTGETCIQYELSL